MSDQWPRPGPAPRPSRDTGDYQFDELPEFAGEANSDVEDYDDDYDDYDDYDDHDDYDGAPDVAGGWARPHPMAGPISSPSTPSSPSTFAASSASWATPQRYSGEPERRPGPRGPVSGPQWSGPLPDRRRSDGGRDSGTPRQAWLLGVMGVVSCLALALIFFLTNNGPEPDPVSAGDGAANGIVDGAVNNEAQASGSTPASGATGSTEVAQEAADTAAAAPAITSGPGSSGSPVTGEMSNDQIVVTGAVPSTQASHSLVLALETVVGSGNVDAAGLTVDSAASTPNQVVLVAANETVFAPSSHAIEADFLPILDNVAELMGSHEGLSATVEGHADADGSASANLSLSQRRAEAVTDYLVSKGIDKVRLVSVGMGSDEPVADNSTPEGRAKNRRIEITITGFEF